MPNNKPPSQTAVDLLAAWRASAGGAAQRPASPPASATPAPGPGRPAPSPLALQLLASLRAQAGGSVEGVSYVAPTAGGFTPYPQGSGIAQGIDIAQVNETWNPLGAPNKPAFAIFKVSEGIAPYGYSNFYSAAQAAGTPIIGAYHFIRPDVSTAGQVRTFLNQVSGKDFSFYAVDLENSPVAGPVTHSLADQARSFIQQVSQATGKPVLLYTNQSTLGQFFNKPSDANIPLWLASSTVGGAISAQGLPGRNIVLWQSPKLAPALDWGTQTNPNPATFAEQGVDYNRAGGSVTELQAQLQQVAASQSALYPR